jgi:hypothetical protein
MTTLREASRRLQFIVDECAPRENQKEAETIAQMDDFARLKQTVAQQLKDVRVLLKDREELFTARGTSAETAECSWRIRLALKQCKEMALQMEKLQVKELKKAEKDMKGGWIQETLKSVRDGPDGETVDCGDVESPPESVASPEAKEALDRALTRKDVVDLVWSHIDEVEGLEKKRFTDKISAVSSVERTVLLAAPARQPIGVSPTSATTPSTAVQDYLSTDLADIEATEDMKLINNNKQLIDQELDGIKAGVGALREIAEDMEGVGFLKSGG